MDFGADEQEETPLSRKVKTKWFELILQRVLNSIEMGAANERCPA